ncbi:MAG: class I SAM-dependent methyltransferase [Thermoanaerobaculia bacterium]|nr:MAG: class I SAM-dependent methyltransferase [Thermoanaerobaculia bacterium]
MKLNRFEKALMNNPARAALQRWYEAPLLERLGGRVDGLSAMEIGCGRGVGTEIIIEQFGAARVQAFDLDPDMVEKARRRLARYTADRVHVAVGDASAIAADDQAFDAVFDFGIIHHVPDWRRAVSEVARVLRTGGRFFFEEVTRHALDRWAYRTFLDHPEQDRFDAEQFVAECKRQGIAVGGNFRQRFFGDFVFGVGRRESERGAG